MYADSTEETCVLVLLEPHSIRLIWPKWIWEEWNRKKKEEEKEEEEGGEARKAWSQKKWEKKGGIWFMSDSSDFFKLLNVINKYNFKLNHCGESEKIKMCDIYNIHLNNIQHTLHIHILNIIIAGLLKITSLHF